MPELANNCRIKFHYENEIIEVKRHNNPLTIVRPVTHCKIKDGDETISQATVRLHQDDNASKIVGRTHAFKKAIKEVEDKKVRTKYWEMFRDEMRQVS